MNTRELKEHLTQRMGPRYLPLIERWKELKKQLSAVEKDDPQRERKLREVAHAMQQACAQAGFHGVVPKSLDGDMLLLEKMEAQESAPTDDTPPGVLPHQPGDDTMSHPNDNHPAPENDTSLTGNGNPTAQHIDPDHPADSPSPAEKTEPKRIGHANPEAEKVPHPGGIEKPNADTLEEGQDATPGIVENSTQPRKLSDGRAPEDNGPF